MSFTAVAQLAHTLTLRTLVHLCAFCTHTYFAHVYTAHLVTILHSNRVLAICSTHTHLPPLRPYHKVVPMQHTCVYTKLQLTLPPPHLHLSRNPPRSQAHTHTHTHTHPHPHTPTHPPTHTHTHLYLWLCASGSFTPSS